MMNTAMPTRFKLDKFLNQHQITVYNLAKHTKGKLSRTSLYNLTNEPKAIQLSTLDVLIDTLSRITGENVQFDDLFERVKGSD